MKNGDDRVKWTAVGRFAVQFVNGKWASEECCRSHRDAMELAKRLNEEDQDHESS